MYFFKEECSFVCTLSSSGEGKAGNAFFTNANTNNEKV